MSERIMAMAAICSPCGCLGDVGCDHGYIGLWMLKNGICSRTLEIDISEPSLNKARALFCEEECEDRAEFIVGDGLTGAGDADAAIIAGMGGKLIGQIIADSMALARRMDYLILQPNSSAAALRRFVTENGFLITDERICHENGRFYPILRVEQGRSIPLTELELELGPINLSRRQNTLKEYAAYRLKVHEDIVATMEKGAVRDATYFASVKMIEQLKEYLEDA